MQWIQYLPPQGNSAGPNSYYTLPYSIWETSAENGLPYIRAAWLQTWPITRGYRDDVTAQVVCGYGQLATDVPLPIRQAIKLLVAHMYANRGEVPAEMPKAIDALDALPVQGVLIVPIDYCAQGGVIAGDLRERLAYQTVSEGTPSQYGDSAQIWNTLSSLWAEVTILSGRELLAAKEIHAEAQLRVVIRYNAAVDSSGRFYWNGNYVYPASIVPDPLQRKMTCICYMRPGEQ